ncbi:MAG: carbamoyl-phosphate synthase large subunit, partial [Bdellovibrionales bacterium]|nr:carbamoyl-phosphate synthase large subunit [Bdellovibrionales bacterium]
MPKREDIKRVVILGSGPIVIGQACEFDYSGTQACKALMKEGLEVILINSNPATIMTDPELATRVYIEPLKLSFVKRILEKEKPDAIIPTLGGQTALNLALELHKDGILEQLGIKLLGANPEVIKKAEDRELFRDVLDSVGAKYPKSEMVKTYEQGLTVADKFGLPIILRPNYTLGGGGGGIAYSLEEYQSLLVTALHESPTSEVLVEESILGWKEFELEVMRDKAGTFVVICSIENLDPCGVHTGDSITVAPQQTLSDYEYQAMRDEAGKIINAVGVETGGANIQFAVNPATGERLVIEMNPRVSRSSALASKATGFPIAKIAALLAIGYELEELKNDITQTTPSCYEPALDYVVTKIPRFAFEKFHGVQDIL